MNAEDIESIAAVVEKLSKPDDADHDRHLDELLEILVNVGDQLQQNPEERSLEALLAEEVAKAANRQELVRRVSKSIERWHLESIARMASVFDKQIESKPRLAAVLADLIAATPCVSAGEGDVDVKRITDKGGSVVPSTTRSSQRKESVMQRLYRIACHLCWTSMVALLISAAVMFWLVHVFGSGVWMAHPTLAFVLRNVVVDLTVVLVVTAMFIFIFPLLPRNKKG